MTKLRPYLPFDASESPMSWATRLAAVHTGESVVPFLHDIGIHLDDMWVNRDSVIERLCDITGEDPDLVWPNTIRLVSWRSYILRGNAFKAEFLHGTNMMFCPACLAEDDARGSYPAAQRRGQMIWLLRQVRTCPHHHLPLMMREARLWSDSLRQMALRVPERGDDLAKLTADLTPRAPSPLQDYILARLEGQPGPDWLDGQNIEQAFRATEMLGVILVFGPKPNLKQMTQDQWDTAGRAGYEFTCRNEEGIREALRLVHTRFVQSGVGKSGVAGPQMVFGRLYQWLEFSKNSKEPGPIRDLVREHILDTLEVAPDKILLGELVGVRRRHSVQTLAIATGTHPKTLRNFLLLKEMIPTDPGQALIATVDAAEGELVAMIMKGAVHQRQLPKILNTTRGQTVQLVESGILATLSSEVRLSGGRQGAVARDVVERFLADISRNAQPVETVPEGMFGIPEAAQISRVTTTVIVRLLLDGNLSEVYQLIDVLGYGGILLDPAEIRRIAKPDVPEVAVPAYMMVGRLGFSSAVIKALMAPRDDGAFLPTVPTKNYSKVLVLVEGAEDFARKHVGLLQLSKEVGIHHISLRKKLDAAGVMTIDDPARLHARIYRREDIPAF